MYKAKFVSDKGITYLFGAEGKTAFSMDVGNGMSVNLGTSQGFLQIGETVETQSIRGKTISVQGAVYGNVKKKKDELRKAFAPFTAGKLIFNDTHFIRVYVQNTPTFSAKKGDGRFTMLLYAPNPTYQSINKTVYDINKIKPLFMFPLNYAEPHKFGEKMGTNTVLVQNNGDVPVSLSVEMYFTTHCENIKIENVVSRKFMKINGYFDAGLRLKVGRNERGIFYVTQTDGVNENDLIGNVDEASTLWEIPVGDSLIGVFAEVGQEGIMAKISFNEAVVSVYET